MCVCVVGQTLQMASCPLVAPAAEMEKRTGKTGPRPPLLHPTQSIPVGQLSTSPRQDMFFIHSDIHNIKMLNANIS